jgi:hypothetical protein
MSALDLLSTPPNRILTKGGDNRFSDFLPQGNYGIAAGTSTGNASGPLAGGKNKQTKEKFTYKGGNYIVHTGPRGGRYINHKGSKVYI